MQNPDDIRALSVQGLFAEDSYGFKVKHPQLVRCPVILLRAFAICDSAKVTFEKAMAMATSGLARSEYKIYRPNQKGPGYDGVMKPIWVALYQFVITSGCGYESVEFPYAVVIYEEDESNLKYYEKQLDDDSESGVLQTTIGV